MILIAIILSLCSIYASTVLGMMVQCSNFASLKNTTLVWCLIAPIFLPYSIINVAIYKKSWAVLELFLHFSIVTTIFFHYVSEAEFEKKVRKARNTKKNRKKYKEQIIVNVNNSILKQADLLANAA